MKPQFKSRNSGYLSPGVRRIGLILLVVLAFVLGTRWNLKKDNAGGEKTLGLRDEVGAVKESVRAELEQLTEKIVQLQEELLELRKAGKNALEPKAELKTSAKQTKASPFVYKVKDPRPLTVKTPLVPNENLWLYPSNQRQLSPNDAKGPWYSQHGQDKMLYTGFFRNHFKGTYVELGAGDGTFLSNTRFFHDSMGWSGVLIEPSDDFEKLKKGISGRQEFPKRCQPEGSAKCYHMAACQREGTIKMIRPRSDIDPTVSGAVDFLTDEHVQHFRLDRSSVFEIPCRPFGAIMNDANIKHIDFLSLDVEGAEETVLETMDWSIPIHVIVVEADESNSPTGPEGHERKHRILLENGFQFLDKIGFDEWWVNPKNSRVKSPV